VSAVANERMEAIRLATQHKVFPTLVPITRMDGTVGPIDPTPTQSILFDFFARHRWTYVDKYRQARSSIAHDADILRHIAYSPGQMGLVVGDKEKTYKEQLRRIAIMYAGLPDLVRPELARPASSEAIAFAHLGEIQGLTGGGENPAIGFSPDYALITEYGLFESFDTFNGSFFPAINRRPNGICRIETTPGRYMTEGHEMYLSALDGKGRFAALFLSWWHDESCWLQPPRDFEPTPEERDYRKKVQSFEKDAIGRPWYPYRSPLLVSDGHLYFRRIAIETEFHGDPRLFDSKYPPTPYEGWLATTNPAVPQDAIEEYLLQAKDTPFGEEVYFEEREPGCPYALIADGAGFGKSGDPSSFLLVNMWDWSEAGSFEGREDPNLFAKRLMRVQKEWGADVIVESNKDGVCSSLVTMDCPQMHWSNGQPGWFASETSKSSEFASLVSMLRKREPKIRSRATLMQMASWDGKGRGRATVNGKKHHFDRATCWLIFAYAARVLGHSRRPASASPARQQDGWSADEFLSMFEPRDSGPKNVLGRLR
jgi:hypothetical protein